MKFDHQSNQIISKAWLIADLKVRLFPNGYMKNETSRIQLLTLTWIYVKTEWWTIEWNMNDKSQNNPDYFYHSRNNPDYFYHERNAL